MIYLSIVFETMIFTKDFLQSRVSTKTTNYTIEDLIPATNYTVEVSAYNIAGIRDEILPAKASFRTKDRGISFEKISFHFK